MKPVQIGITGGIGSGKTVVCKALTILGIPVYNADESSKFLLENDPDIISAVSKLFGSEAYHVNGGANRTFIAGVVFNNPEKLTALNNILHPAVLKHYHSWVTKHSSSAILAKEAAIMFESGSNKELDWVIAVIAPAAIREKRIIGRDNRRPEDIQKIIQQQLPEAELINRSDFVIINDDHHLVVPQILSIINTIKSKSSI